MATIHNMLRQAEAIAEIRELHSDSGELVEHYCSLTGGSMEPSHNKNDKNYCNECGIETAWPCATVKILDKAGL